MRASVVAGIVALCALSLAVGTGLGHRLGSMPAEVDAPPAAPPWQADLRAAQATAEAGSMRATALEVLNTADGDVALAEALDLLGWAGGDEDVPLLESFALSRDPVLAAPAIEALGRIGSDQAATILVGLLGRRGTDRHAAVVALGASGRADALAHLEPLLDDPILASSTAWALAAHGSPEAVSILAEALTTIDPRHVSSVAHGLASLSATIPAADEALKSTLAGPRTPRRNAVLQALAGARDPVVYDVLVADLERGTATTAGMAAHGLGQLGDPRAVPLLARAARQSHSEVRYAAMSALGILDSPDGDQALLKIIETAQGPLAARAVSTLPRVDDPEVLDRLLAAGLRRPTEVRHAIEGRLFGAPWRRGEVPEAVLELARASLESPGLDGWGTDPVALLLTHGGREDAARIERMLVEGTGQARTAAVWSLQQLAGPEAERLLLLLADDPDPGVRQAALSGLLERGLEEEVENRLIGHLESGTPDYGATEHLLIRLGTRRAVGVLLQRIETGTAREWSGAVSAIANSGSAEDVQRLLEIADDTDNPQLEQHILSALVYSETADLQRVVDRALNSGSPQLEATATQALVRLGTDDARDKLLGLADAEAPETRQAALNALAQVGGDEAERKLVEALEDPDAAWSAVSGLQQIGTESARQALVDAATGAAAPEVRASVMHQLPWLHGVDSAGILGQALQDEDATVRGSAISALESLGSSQAAETLATLMNDADVDDTERMAAATALQRLGGKVAEQHAQTIEELATVVDTGFAGGMDDLVFPE